ncbi:MAG: TrmH family RNA methyltransferase [Phycisphaerales bacterium]
MPILPIESIDDPRVADYSQVREAELRADRFDAPGGLFIAEGELVIRRLLASRYPIRSMLITRARLATLADLLTTLPGDVPVYLVEQHTMNAVVGFNIHRGALAIGQRGPEPALHALLQPARCAVILENLANHDNLGGIFRNVAALGAGCFGRTCILLSPRCADPLYRKSIRVSMGAALQVPFATLNDWSGGLELLKQSGFHVIAMTPADDAQDIAQVAHRVATSGARPAILLGAEGPGLSPESLRLADVRARIPMPGRDDSAATLSPPDAAVDSLNVAVACAISLHRLFH